MALPQSVANPTRTGIQLSGAAIIVEFIDAFFYDFDDRQYAAILAVLTVLVGLAQNYYEQRTGKYLFKPREVL